MESEKKENISAPHVLVLPFPVQGHINPMLQFAKRLASRGLSVTLGTTIFYSKNMRAQMTGGSVRLDTISDGYDEGGFLEAEDPKAYHHGLEEVGSRTLAELIEKYKGSVSPFTCLVYDTSLHWALNVAKELGLMGIAFYTQSCAAFAIYYHLSEGRLTVPSEEGGTLSLQGLPPLAIVDLPSLVFEVGSYQPVLSLKIKQFCNLDKADWVLFNTTEELENEVVSFLKGLWPVKTIGPTLPFMYLDASPGEEDKDYGFNYYKPSSTKYVEWLDSKPVGSVAYVSFGSIAAMTEQQMEELAWGLSESHVYFLWVVRASEQQKLPKKFAENTKEKGLIVTWCNQLQVLAHAALGCFVTHCGWNSVLEALSLGVPMVGIPQWTDQPTNAKYVEDVWGVGVRARADKKGIVGREEMKMCVTQVLEGMRGKEMQTNACKWRDVIKGAAREGGSSVKNIEDFVEALMNYSIERKREH
ncbi:mogroside IE synthase-like [Aristolochia californica]|uniref:mogroside IE synthase-like n=1 Tax=Aristolochia californica TaxID=171875 RepID=UPI0035DBB4DB